MHEVQWHNKGARNGNKVRNVCAGNNYGVFIMFCSIASKTMRLKKKKHWT